MNFNARIRVFLHNLRKWFLQLVSTPWDMRLLNLNRRMYTKITFKVSSWVLKEFIRRRGTLHPYFLLRDCREHIGQKVNSWGRKLTEYSLQKYWLSFFFFFWVFSACFTSIWITIKSRNVNPFRTSMTDLQQLMIYNYIILHWQLWEP